MSDWEAQFQADVTQVSNIAAVPSILQVICQTTGMGFAAVARVTEGRWIACSVLDTINFGLKPGGELKVETTICHEIRQSGEGVVIDHVAEDQMYCGHPTPAMYGFQSYISFPIVRGDGSMFGTLCAIDPLPHKLKTPNVIGMFKLFAELIAFHIDSVDQLASSQASLLDERKTAELREQFIAVLGHDLRNPLASIDAALRIIQRSPLDEKGRQVAVMAQNSILRMANLITNMLDFARARLGGGFAIDRNSKGELHPVLHQVIDELATSNLDREIDVKLDFDDPIDCDPARIGQLFQNVLSNALSHGAEDRPIRITAATRDGAFMLAVTNAGDPITPTAMKFLFQPFARGDLHSSKQGLGLGLYISSEIARAHGGMLTVVSDETETRFTFQMPLS